MTYRSRVSGRAGRVAGAVLAIGIGGVAAPVVAVWAAPAPASSKPVVLDVEPPIAVGVLGDRVAWVRRASRNHEELVVRETPTAAERVVVAKIPFRATHVTVGTDRGGRATIVLEREGLSDVGFGTETRHESLYAVPFAGGRLRRLPVSNVPGQESAPGLRGGRLSFARTAGRNTTVRLGSLSSTHARVLYRTRPEYVVSTAVGVGGRVAFTTERDRASRLRVAGPHAKARQLAATFTGPDDGDGLYGFGLLTVSADGRRATVSRYEDEDLGSVSNNRSVAPQRAGTSTTSTSTTTTTTGPQVPTVTIDPDYVGYSRLFTYDLVSRRLAEKGRTDGGDGDVSAPLRSGGYVSYLAPEFNLCPRPGTGAAKPDDPEGCPLIYVPKG